MEKQAMGKAELADRASRRRAGLMIVMGVLVVIQQISFIHNESTGRAVDYVRAGGWVAMSVAMLFIVLTGGAFLRGREMRELMNDEVSQANRAKAIARGYKVAMGLAIALYALSEYREISARAAIHLIVTFGLAAALISFGKLERRSLG